MLPPLRAERCTPKDHVCPVADLAAATALTQALAAMQPSALMPAKLHRKPVRACAQLGQRFALSSTANCFQVRCHTVRCRVKTIPHAQVLLHFTTLAVSN